MTQRLVIAPFKRLLTRAEAAAYCSMSLTAFETVCPVKPIRFGEDRRLDRYDVHALDHWIDRLANPDPGSDKTKEDRLAEF